ncbi:thyroid adenoma-associated protein homolog isoform X2 [Ooceraea biroi]|uniref:thyroid adenoma-associated protein homolog isoform X2 n=1 Tax=Ooceraea biroi TaxID=2015173 RepID=UPI000F094EAB|nr:thyroid adenoma-associated protein homolog isoform X2 [Ooceraea biroi]
MQESGKMNEKELFELLSDLRKSKQNGKLDTDEKLAQQTLKWRDTLEYHVLETSVRHHSEECRLETLALLVESKKSTLRFTRMELDMILSFLRYNFGEKMEYVPYIKKALKRLKDSLAVMQRQLAQEEKMRSRFKEQDVTSEIYESVLASSYQMSKQIVRDMKEYAMFFIDLRQACVSNLYPDATYDRRRSSLQMLLLMQELLRDEYRSVEWTKEQAETIFQCLLLDTYEPNKEMAYQILKPMNPTLLGLDSEVRLMIRIALELSNSMRPIDSATAAYMLKISKRSPVIRDVLCHYCDVEDSVVEGVTLQLVLLLQRKLQKALASTKLNIGTAFLKCSVYGCLFCVRSLFSDCDLSTGLDEAWRDAIGNVTSLCFELNQSVSVIVNNSSPEGHLPMDLRSTLDFRDHVPCCEQKIVTPQMVLLCSWRTVKEVSQLFGLLATKASIQTDSSSDGLLRKEQIEEIMKHLVSLLCETKHRGAFEQVYVGFHQLCTRLWRLTDTALNLLPLRWLHDILIGITGLMPGYSKLCATRRSAGVPFMIQAVLSSEPGTCDDFKMSASHSVMKILLQFTELESTINLWEKVRCIVYKDTIFSQYKHLIEPLIENKHSDEEIKVEITQINIHSMNILRALFRHSQLRNMVKNYIANGLLVAFKSYDSKTWTERNAAALLFSALIVRIFGVQRTKDHINLTTDNKMTGKIFFERYSTLLPFILNELRTFVSINNTEIKSNVQAILLLLSRLYISYHFDDTDVTWKINEFVNLVSQCAKSPEHKTRELAARALVPLLTESTACDVVRKLFLVLCKARDTRISANLIHGYLLQILEILTKLPLVGVQLLKSDATDLLRSTEWILKDLENKSNGFSCFPIAAVYIDILHKLYNLNKDMLVSCGQLSMDNMLHMLQQHLTEERLLKQGPGEQMYKVSVIRFILRVGEHSSFLQTMLDAQSNAHKIYSRLLIKRDVEIQSIAWNTLFEVLEREPQQQKQLLSAYAVRAAAGLTAERFYSYCPKTEDALFNFLYKSLMDTDEHCTAAKREICDLVLEKIPPCDGFYSDRFSYFRVLGKCMTTVIHELKDEKLETKHRERVYRGVCNNVGWMSDLPEDCRSSFFDILYDLFDKNDVDPKHCHPTLDWWTMLLQLLVNDNADIRRRASELVCRIEPRNELECIERTLPVFLQKFNETIADKCPGVAIVALFYWSVLSFGDMFDEIDETEIFVKYKNYNVFEPVRISELCFGLTKKIMQRYSIDSALPPGALKWIDDRVPHINFHALSSFKDIVRNYGITMSTVERRLDAILDPMYKDRLLIYSAYEKYVSLE